MAKSTKQNAREAKPIEPDTVTYSTRFDSKQRAIIEQAAAILNWSPAKLIREGAVRRSVDVVNSAGRAEIHLRNLAAEVAQRLHDPLVTGTFVERFRDEIIGSEPKTMGFLEAQHLTQRPTDPDEPWYEVTNLKPVGMNEKVASQIREAMRTSGTRFLELVLQEWEARLVTRSGYQPKVSAEELLSGGNKEDGSDDRE